MELNLERPLLFFDIESTGLSIVSDSIVELSFVKVFPDNHHEVKTWRVCPWDYSAGKQKSIDPGASQVNGIKDEDVANEPKFIEIAPEVVEWLKDSDLAGYNSTKFDLPMLAEEIERVRTYCESRIKNAKTSADKKEKAQKTLAAIDIDLHAKQMIDVQTIYHYMEPRNLKAAYRFYCGGEDFENAHSAEADTLATYEVLKGELEMYQQPDKFHDCALKNSVEFLSGVGGRPRTVDYAGRLILGKNNEPTISFGKHKGRTAREVYETEPAYFAWIMNGEFTMDTKRQFARLKEQFESEKKKPLDEKEVFDAKIMLKEKFEQGK
ncbi:MAG: exonuclease domain-containing protein [Candidatus Cryptobacteroides sp.]|nr:3'-5' exonuclease [Bacteroides sp.]MDY5301404.1 exonuclease domain-containing protein [Candidatus Cryptobacteroides sp.]